MGKTYIEFFDKPDIDNIMPTLAQVPDRVIFLGKNCKAMRKRVAKYERVIGDRGYNVEFLCKEISQGNLAKNVELINELINTYENCCFDIDGGEEILLVALGVAFEQNKDKKIQINKYNLHTREFYDCDNDGEVCLQNLPQLSIDENVRIYGGEVVYDSVSGDSTDCWDLTADFLKDINTIWNICKKNFADWNEQVVSLSRLEANKSTANPMTSFGSVENFVHNNTIIQPLINAGLITEFFADSNIVRVTYKNFQVKRCLIGAGMILELKIYATLKGLRDQNGAPIYNDVLNGVVIDWDGEVHESFEKKYDTVNEIDIMAMHEIVPIFISCKNGKFSADELYKLNTVAQRFGDEYAQKILVTTQLSALGKGACFVEQRAQDMKIKILEIKENMTDAELESKLKNLWNLA